MNLDDIEELIRRYFSTGIAVVLVLVAPGAVDERATGNDPAVIQTEPERSAEPEPRAEDQNESTAPTTPPEYEPPGAEPDEQTRRDAEPGEGPGDADSEDRTENDSAAENGGTAEDGGDNDPDTADRTTDDPTTDDPTTDDSGAEDPAADDRSAEPDADTSGQNGDDDTGGTDGDGQNGDGKNGDGTGGDGTGGDGTGGDGDDTSDTDETDEDAGDPPSRDTGSSDPDLDARGPADGSGPGADDEPSATDDDADTRAAGAAGGGTEGVTAAETLGWGTPAREDDFTSGSAQWTLYDGPGHAGEGVRSPDAVSIEDGVLVLTGDSSGTTAGMSWGEGQKYGRWEGRVRAPASDPSYNALMLLWPDAEDFPVGGEIDFMEMLDPTRQRTDFFLHFGEDNEQLNGQVEIDGTQWHNWAVEWTPDAITGYVDGEEWFRSTDPSTFPPGPMHLCIQLDWFPEGSSDTVQESRMEVDWVRQYSLDEPTSGESVPTDGAQAEDEPDPVRRMFSWS